MNADEQLKIALTRFTGAFELLFHEDWDYTLAQLQHHADRTVAGGTFLRPGPESRIVNWGAVECFYRAYEQLEVAMRINALYPNLPEPDDWYQFGWPDESPEQD